MSEEIITSATQEVYFSEKPSFIHNQEWLLLQIANHNSCSETQPGAEKFKLTVTVSLEPITKSRGEG
jgi:hypothetical protein